jgi:hypothetical protein
MSLLGITIIDRQFCNPFAPSMMGFSWCFNFFMPCLHAYSAKAIQGIEARTFFTEQMYIPAKWLYQNLQFSTNFYTLNSQTRNSRGFGVIHRVFHIIHRLSCNFMCKTVNLTIRYSANAVFYAILSTKRVFCANLGLWMSLWASERDFGRAFFC